MPNGRIVKPGAVVEIPCQTKKGFFSDEILVRCKIPGTDNLVVGYVPQKSVKERQGQFYVMAVIASLAGQLAQILFSGEIISSSNPVSVPTKSIESLLVS